MTSIPLSRWRRYTFKTAIFSLRQRVKERKWKKFSSSSSRLSLERKSLLSFFFFFKFSFNHWYPIPFRGEFFHAHVATPRDSCRDGTRRENWIQSIWRGFIREIDLWWWKIYRYLLSPLFKWNSTWSVTWKLEVKKWYHTINY